MKQKLDLVFQLVTQPYKGWMAASVVGSVIIGALDLLGVAAMVPLMQLVTVGNVSGGPLAVVARIVGTEDPKALMGICAGIVALAFLVKSATTILFRWWLIGKTTELEADAGTELLRRYVASPYLAHRRRELAEIHRNIVSSLNQAFAQVVLGFLSMTADALSIIFVGVILALVSPLATVVALVVFGVILWVAQRGFRSVYLRMGERLAEADLRSWSAMMPAINGFRETRMAGVADVFVGRFGEAKRQRARAVRVTAILGEIPKYALEIGMVLAISAMSVVLFATTSVQGTFAIIGVFAAGSVRLLPTLNRLVASIAIVRGGQVGLTILAEEVEDLNSGESFVGHDRPRTDFRGDIRFTDVTFCFPDAEEPVVKGLDYVIGRGSTVAFTGASGAGKSTVLDLLMGLMAPTTGTITSGGTDIQSDLTSWYAEIGVVPQDVFLIDASLAANIAFAESEIDEARLRKAVEMAQLSSMLEELPEGLSTRLGERGVRLSGGQRQRVGIARALYREPKILILDEATSALDNVTESKFSQTLERLKGQLTIVIVAHRLSTVRQADEVVYFENGRLVSSGTFTELRDKSQGFAELVRLGSLA